MNSQCKCWSVKLVLILQLCFYNRFTCDAAVWIWSICPKMKGEIKGKERKAVFFTKNTAKNRFLPKSQGRGFLTWVDRVTWNTNIFLLGLSMRGTETMFIKRRYGEAPLNQRWSAFTSLSGVAGTGGPSRIANGKVSMAVWSTNSILPHHINLLLLTSKLDNGLNQTFLVKKWYQCLSKIKIFIGHPTVVEIKALNAMSEYYVLLYPAVYCCMAPPDGTQISWKTGCADRALLVQSFFSPYFEV